MPELLWEGTVALMCRYGVGPIARGSRLDYYSVKRPAAGPETGSPGAADGARTFVEVDLAGVRGGHECRIELVGGDAVKMTVAMQGVAARDLVWCSGRRGEEAPLRRACGRVRRSAPGCEPVRSGVGGMEGISATFSVGSAPTAIDSAIGGNALSATGTPGRTWRDPFPVLRTVGPQALGGSNPPVLRHYSAAARRRSVSLPDL